jgi:hypothetical protein
MNLKVLSQNKTSLNMSQSIFENINVSSDSTATFDQCYDTLLHQLKLLEIESDLPEKITWKEYTLNPDHGVYLKNFTSSQVADQFFIEAETKEHEPYVINGYIIRNYLHVHFRNRNRPFSFEFAFFDGDLLDKSEERMKLYFKFIVPELYFEKFKISFNA